MENMDNMEKLVKAEGDAVRVPADLKDGIASAVASAGEPDTVLEQKRAEREALVDRRRRFPAWAIGTAAALILVVLFGVGLAATAIFPGSGISTSTTALGRLGGAADDAMPPFDAGETIEGVPAPELGSYSAIPQSDDSIAAQSGNGAGTIVGPEPFPGVSNPGVPPQVIKTGSVGVEVKKFEEAWADANALPKTLGGFVESSRVNQSGDGDSSSSGSLTARIPAERLDEAITGFSDLGELKTQQTSTNDVAGELIDMDARLRSATAEEEALTALLGRATDIDDILRVREQLNQVRYEIESLNGRKDALTNQVQYSTLTVDLYEDASTVDPGEQSEFEQALARAMSVALTVLYGLLMVLAVAIPFALLALVIVLVVRLARRRS